MFSLSLSLSLSFLFLFHPKNNSLSSMTDIKTPCKPYKTNKNTHIDTQINSLLCKTVSLIDKESASTTPPLIPRRPLSLPSLSISLPLSLSPKCLVLEGTHKKHTHTSKERERGGREIKSPTTTWKTGNWGRWGNGEKRHQNQPTLFTKTNLHQNHHQTIH